MLRKFVIGAAGAFACLSAASAPTFAHVTLERQEAPVGASYKAVLRVPHGCSGSPTTAIRVRVPAGIIGVKPMPKPGWELNAVTGKYPKPYTLRGAQVTEGVTEISWSGGKLPDAHYDEFVFIGMIAQELDGTPAIYVPGRAGMREGRASLDRDPDRQAFRRARRGQRRARGGAAPAAEAEVAVRIFAFLIVLLTALVQSSAAFAHAALVRAEPADGALVAEPPASLRLIFNEPVTPLVMRLIAPDGTVATVAAASENTTVTVKPPALRRGTHVLSWRVISADGHPVGGSLVFSVGEASAQPVAGALPAGDMVVRSALWAAKVVIYLALLVGIGGAFVRVWLVGGARAVARSRAGRADRRRAAGHAAVGRPAGTRCAGPAAAGTGAEAGLGNRPRNQLRPDRDRRHGRAVRGAVRT